MNRVGNGICVHDDDGDFVLAKTLSFSPLCSVQVSEALGLFNAIEWLSDMQMDNVDIVWILKQPMILFILIDLMF